MKILFDHQTFEKQKFGGISRYFYELIKNFDENEFVEWDLAITYSDNEYLKKIPAFHNKLLPRPDYLKEFLWGMDFKGKKILFSLKKKIESKLNIKDFAHINKGLTIEKLKKGDFDIFHPTYFDDYFLEYIGEKPFVITVYDLIFQVFPEFFMDFAVDKNVEMLNKASHIIAISESTKKDLINIYNLDEKRITVTHLANSLEKHQQELREDFKRRVPAKYILFVGTRGAYKNFYFFAQVWASLSKGEKDIFLICTGPAFTPGEIKFLKNIDLLDRIIHLYVEDEELSYLYENAIAFIFPSLYEGFGLPVLESFYHNCPVLTSNTSSLSEIGGTAAIYFDPKNADSIKNALRKVLYDKEFVRNKIEEGGAQLRKFNWKKTAVETKEVYENILKKKQ